MATGCSFKELHYTYRRGSTTASEIVRDVCRQIWFKLQPIHLSKPNKKKWQDIAQQFKSRANFPNCLGAVDGKHIRIIHPPNSGSLYWNYKHFFSIVLLAVCDSNYLFTYVDIGAYGKTSDSTIWKDSSLYKKMKKNELDLPEPEIISMDGNRLPYVFIGDEAFGLNEHMLRPYSGKQISEKKRVFNYRLSRARRYVECSFGILANKWRILHRPLNVAVDFAEDIVKACVVLHNIVRKQDGYNYEDTLMTPDFIPFENNEEYRVGRSVNLVRDKFADYFISPEGELHWQYTM